jgi:hypothetical protein
MQEYCKSDKGKQQRVDEYNKRINQAKSQPEWRSKPQSNQGPSTRSNFYNRSNVNNVSGNNSQMASSAATGGRGQSPGRGPPQFMCSLHGLNKGHWSYECRTLLRNKQIEEDKKRTTQSQVKTVNYTSSTTPSMAQSSMQNWQPYIPQSCFQQMSLPPPPMFNLNMIQLQQQSIVLYQPKLEPAHQEPSQAK